MAATGNDKSVIWGTEREQELRTLFSNALKTMGSAIPEERLEIIMEASLKFFANKKDEAEAMLKKLGPIGVVAFQMLGDAYNQRAVEFKKEHKLKIN